MFKAAGAVGDIDAEDAAYWNVEHESRDDGEQIIVSPDPLIVTAMELGASVTREETAHEMRVMPETAEAYLDSVTLIANAAQWRKLRAELLERASSGMSETDLCEWLSSNRIIFPGCEGEVATKLREFVSTVTSVGIAADTKLTKRAAMPVKPKTKKANKIVPFPQPEPAHSDAPVRQLALF
jgi:hypothetical protein